MLDSDTASCGARRVWHFAFERANDSWRLDMARGRWCIDVLCGAGGVAGSLRAEGFPCVDLEIKKGFDI
eukprot:804601-Pyramimonas_sp.AAC.1